MSKPTTEKETCIKLRMMMMMMMMRCIFYLWYLKISLAQNRPSTSHGEISKQWIRKDADVS